MSDRDLYLAAYDVAHPSRLRAALDRLRGYATGGQKSVHEVFLTSAEKVALLRDMGMILDTTADRFFLLRLDPRTRCYTLGVATAPSDGSYFYVG